MRQKLLIGTGIVIAILIVGVGWRMWDHRKLEKVAEAPRRYRVTKVIDGDTIEIETDCWMLRM